MQGCSQEYAHCDTEAGSIFVVYQVDCVAAPPRHLSLSQEERVSTSAKQSLTCPTSWCTATEADGTHGTVADLATCIGACDTV